MKPETVIETPEGGLQSAPCSAWSIYQLNDCDWWIARSLNEAIVDALRNSYGMEISDNPTPEELVKFEGAELEEPREVTPEEMDRLQYRAGDGDEDFPVVSFREELNSRIERGIIEVGMFASTEC